MKARYREQKLKNEARKRRIRIINDLIGEHRVYRGDIILQDVDEARTCTDADLLFGIEHQYDAGRAIVYWADGSQKTNSHFNACLGAGVVWQEKRSKGEWVWRRKSFPLGIDTGTSIDTELYAVAASLCLAKNCSEQGRDLEVVRIFSDCRTALEGIQSGAITEVGPALASGWALQTIYDHTDFLVEGGISVQLVWQKGHAMSEGNCRADTAAQNAAQSQMSLPSTGRSVWKKKQEAPQGLAGLGLDSLDEWYWRMNRVLLLEGLEESDYVEQEDTESQGSADMDFPD